jgi:hypothetical protein
VSALRAAALVYGAAGEKVFPLNGKVPLTENGVKDATTDPDQIERWWTEHEGANIGLACGRGLMVVDVDGPEGQATLEALMAEHDLPETRWVRTGREGGLHLYFEGEGRGCRLGPGLELRGEGQYVVAPPSTHPKTGKRYTVVLNVDPAPKPDWLRKPEPPARKPSPPVEDETRLRRLRAAADAAVEGELQKLADHSTEAGTGRGTALYAAACALGRHVASGGLPRSFAESQLRAAGERLQLGVEEIERSIDQGLVEGEREPYELTDRDAPTTPDPTKKGRSKPGDSFVRPYFAVSGTKPDPLGDDAYHGLAGKLVRLIAPHSEAAAEALLIQLLTAIGNILGRATPAIEIENAPHRGRLFSVIVGPTGKARKGTAWGRIKYVMRQVDPKWAEHRLRHGGLSSGEGLIQALRGPVPYDLEDLIRALGQGDEEGIEEMRADDTMSALLDAVEQLDKDAGVDDFLKAITDAEKEARDEAEKRDPRELRDGRLLVLEAEFSRVLRVCKREHSITGAILRDLWDGDQANVLTRQKPLAVSGAHLGIIAHITGAELRRELTDAELMNGFANRFLFVYVERSQLLPFGGQVPEQALVPLIDELAEVVAHEWGHETIILDSDAREIWPEQYARLNESRPGLYGSATDRGDTQVIRLALIYALLDRSRMIGIDHLRAALEVWRYCDDSARYLFGGRLGDRVAEFVLAELQASDQGYLDRIKIYDALQRRVTKREIDVALEHLEALGLIRRERIETGGRPKERIHLREGGT